VEPLTIVRAMAEQQHGVVTAVQCIEARLDPNDVRRLCRDRTWLKLHRGVYFVDAPAWGGEPSRLGHIHAAVLSAGPRACAVLGTAAELLGIAGTRREDVVHVSLPGPAARPRRLSGGDVRLHQLARCDDDVITVDGIPVTTPVRTVADLIVRVDRLTAVSIMDSGLNRRIIQPDDLDAIRTRLTGRRGAPKARPWLQLVDARAESPLETRVRLRAVDGGVGPDELQFRVRDQAGTIVAIGDFAWTGARIIGEADGAEAHDNPNAVFRDRLRQNDIVRAGYTPLRFTWEDTVAPGYIPRVLHATIAGAGPWRS
jgi:very-short-patch-repair endonuclease